MIYRIIFDVFERLFETFKLRILGKSIQVFLFDLSTFYAVGAIIKLYDKGIIGIREDYWEMAS